MEQRCNPGGLLRGHRRRWTAPAAVRCEATSDGPSVRMAIGMAYFEVLLVRVVLSALFLAQVDQTFATARPKCGVPHWPATAATGLTCEVLLPREALNFSHRLNPGKIEG